MEVERKNVSKRNTVQLNVDKCVMCVHPYMKKKCGKWQYYDHDEHVEMSAFLDTLLIFSFVDDHAHNIYNYMLHAKYGRACVCIHAYLFLRAQTYILTLTHIRFQFQ